MNLDANVMNSAFMPISSTGKSASNDLPEGNTEGKNTKPCVILSHKFVDHNATSQVEDVKITNLNFIQDGLEPVSTSVEMEVDNEEAVRLRRIEEGETEIGKRFLRFSRIKAQRSITELSSQSSDEEDERPVIGIPSDSHLSALAIAEYFEYNKNNPPPKGKILRHGFKLTNLSFF
jgi:hypothetical protein